MFNKKIRALFIAAGLYNIAGVLLFSKFFTNHYLSEYYPSVFSDFGLIAIILWGMAYISVSKSYVNLRSLMLVFTVEKLVYVVTWVLFLLSSWSKLPEIFGKSVMTGLFLSVYGLGDLLFGCFFAWVGLKGYRIKE